MSPSSIPVPTQIRDRLLADHHEIDRLLEQLLAAFQDDDREEVQSVWAAFDARLVRHLDAEEEFLIPALSRRNERSARAILAEHKLIRARLLELGAGVDLHIVRLASARQFMEELKAHARHEDELLYRWADENVGEADRTALFAAMAATLKARLRRTAAVSGLR